jgi:hypothetical protein
MVKSTNSPLSPWIYVVLGILLLQVGYLLSTSDQLLIWLNEHQKIIDRKDAPTVFEICSVAAFAMATCLLVYGIRGIQTKRTGDDRPISVVKNRSAVVENLWLSANIALVLASIWAGYNEMSPGRLQHTNPDAIFCLCVLVVMSLFAVGTLHLSKTARFRRPSLNRFSLNWSGDPLQALFLSTLVCLGLVVGSLTRVLNSGAVGFWTVAFNCSLFIGLVVGQLVAYRLYRGRIEGK